MHLYLPEPTCALWSISRCRYSIGAELAYVYYCYFWNHMNINVTSILWSVAHPWVETYRRYGIFHKAPAAVVAGWDWLTVEEEVFGCRPTGRGRSSRSSGLSRPDPVGVRTTVAAMSMLGVVAKQLKHHPAVSFNTGIFVISEQPGDIETCL